MADPDETALLKLKMAAMQIELARKDQDVALLKEALLELMRRSEKIERRFTTDQAAHFLGIPLRTFQLMLTRRRNGDLTAAPPHVVIGRNRVHFELIELLAFKWRLGRPVSLADAGPECGISPCDLCKKTLFLTAGGSKCIELRR